MLDVDSTVGLGIDSLEEDSNMLGYTELFERIWTEEELIFTIPKDDEERFKNGLAVAKTRFNKKLMDEGQPKESRQLEYSLVTPCMTEGCINLQVSLKTRGRIRVFDIRKPDPTL